MTSKLTYVLVFLMTFLGISGTVYFLNDNFNNIFAFDFSPAPDLKRINHELKETIDSLNTYYKRTRIDTFYVYNDTSLVRKNNEALIENERLKFEIQTKEEIIAEQADTIKTLKLELEGLKTRLSAKNDEKFQNWVKSTVKLFDTMEAKKAAKILESYSEDLAREIIYKMKKKKAAEILSLLKPETVTKLTGGKNVL